MSTSSSSLPPSLPRTLELRAHISSSASHFVIGVDEAGRGPLAGPVVAAAFVILLPISAAPPPSLEHGIADSKTVGESDRESLFGAISRCAACKQVAFETAVVDHARIDEINILQATFEAMSAAAQALVQKIRCLHGAKASFSILIDGNKVFFTFGLWLLVVIQHIIRFRLRSPPLSTPAHRSSKATA
jgi:ribonuclease HII